MNTPHCAVCGDTGRRTGSDFLDCTACDAATERAALNGAVIAHLLTPGAAASPEDLHWTIHQRALASERQRIGDLMRDWKTGTKPADEVVVELFGRFSSTPAVTGQEVSHG